MTEIKRSGFAGWPQNSKRKQISPAETLKRETL